MGSGRRLLVAMVVLLVCDVGGGTTDLSIGLQSTDPSALSDDKLPSSLDATKFLDPDGLLGMQIDPDFFFGFVDKQVAYLEFHLYQDGGSTDLYGLLDKGGTVPEPTPLALALVGFAALGLRRVLPRPRPPHHGHAAAARVIALPQRARRCRRARLPQCRGRAGHHAGPPGAAARPAAD